MLKEARRLYNLGFAVHWIKPNSKAPVKAGWSSGKRDDWETVKREYQKAYGLGVRLGEASKLGKNLYLANIDVDLKSKSEAHRAEAFKALERNFPGLLAKAPQVKTDNGIRLFVATETPIASGRIASAGYETKAYMPGAPLNRRQELGVEQGKITQKELDRGFRLRPAWEIDFMSRGKQVVLPPSIHPETGKPYIWEKPLVGVDTLPLVDFRRGAKAGSLSGGFRSGGAAGGGPSGSKKATGFHPVADVVLEGRLSAHIVDMIRDGAGVEDRSAACFSVTLAMLRAKFTDQEILTVLTDRDYVLGETAYDHRNTSSRVAAAEWADDYCLKKAKRELDASRAFAEEVVEEVLSDKDAEAQRVELLGATDWRTKLARTGKDGDGPPKPTLKNVQLILENAVHPALFRRDLFTHRTIYGATAVPWAGGEPGKSVDDDDAVNIKMWLATCFGVEPSVGTIFEAIAHIATLNRFHLVREEWSKLPLWDAVPRLDFWLARHFDASGEPEYLGQVLRKWLVAAVSRVYSPGTKFDWIPILQGAQGTGKSSFGAILFGQEYFTDSLPNMADKDAALGLHGKLCIELGELDSLRRTEVDTVKAFITRQVDHVRPPYGRCTVDFKRQCVFFGSTNRREYLKDDTGNRRFMPVRVGGLDFDRLHREREQLLAEAIFLYQNGLESTLYLEGSARRIALDSQHTAMAEDESIFMVEELQRFVKAERKKPETERFPLERFKLASLFQGMGPLSRWKEDGRSIQIAAKALHVIGAEKWTVKGRNWWGIYDLGF